jgi:hypothetical protein
MKSLHLLPKYSGQGSRLMLAVIALVAPATSWGYLGGFEDEDGYNNDYITSGGPFGLGATSYFLNRYNAGVYGTSNGGPGGTPAQIPQNSGLWQQLDGTPMAGNRYVLGHAPTVGATAYAGSSMLGIRNQNPSAQVPLDVRYHMDSRDFNGTSPLLTGGSLIEWELRACPDNPSSLNSDQYAIFYWTFRDAAGDAGLLLGWNDANKVIYKLPSQSSWTVTSHILDHEHYDRFNVSLDLMNDKWSLSVLDFSEMDLLVPLVSDAPLASAMSDFSMLDWHLEYNQAKSFYDKSIFTVTPLPEPTSLLLASAVALGCGLRRRR